MPYIITTGTSWGANLGAQDKYAVVNRFAVATLEETREALQEMLSNLPIWNNPNNEFKGLVYRELVAEALCMDESGGTIGPLPDGTVIEVKMVDAYSLRGEYGQDQHTYAGTLSVSLRVALDIEDDIPSTTHELAELLLTIGNSELQNSVVSDPTSDIIAAFNERNKA